jgi:hypothetical protein
MPNELNQRAGLCCHISWRESNLLHNLKCLHNERVQSLKVSASQDHSSPIERTIERTSFTSSSMSPNDWPNRYYHVDQILDRPGPRTDESFLAGAQVQDGLFLFYIDSLTVSSLR